MHAETASLAVEAGNGHPIFYHRPHGWASLGITEKVIADFDRLAEQRIRNPHNHRYATPAGVTFVTYSNANSQTLIEKCYEAYGIADFVVVSKELVEWNWMAKIKPVLNYLESNSCDSPYIVVTDATDMLLVNDPQNVVDYFKSYNCDLLFCNTMANWPENQELAAFESKTYPTHPFHCHLSAGGYVGNRDAIKKFLTEIVEAFEAEKPWLYDGGAFDDQLSWRHLHHKYFPRIKVDYRSLVFQRYDSFRDRD